MRRRPNQAQKGQATRSGWGILLPQPLHGIIQHGADAGLGQGEGGRCPATARHPHRRVRNGTSTTGHRTKEEMDVKRR